MMVAALGDLQIGVVARRQLDALWRNEINQQIVGLRRRRVFVDRLQHCLILLRASHTQYVRMYGTDHMLISAETTGDDDFTVRVQRFTDRLEGLLFSCVDKAASIDDDSAASS